MNVVKDVVIIGAGLSGLALAYYLRDSGLSISILEARDRIGGRVETVYNDEHQPLEMGATWYGSKHQALIKLLSELKINTFEQHIGNVAIYEAISTSPAILAQLPPNPDPSMRIYGGSFGLVKAIYNQLPNGTVLLNQAVESITVNSEGLNISTSSGHYQSKFVVSTLPPNLLVRNIKFAPALPKELVNIASSTHTWMGESIKIGLTYNAPFWKTNGTSGTIFSNVGPIPEMYDHSNPEEDFVALMGFLNGTYYNLDREKRLEMIVLQLRKYYGNKVDNFVQYHERVWRKEQYTFIDYQDHVLPHQNNGNAIYRKSLFDRRLYIGGTETATLHPGYMDGAIVSAQEIAHQILKDI